MANQLIRNKWLPQSTIPDFGRFLEHVQERLKKPKLITFQTQINPLGIEVEVEGWPDKGKQLICWEGREDGSLKDNGREFVSYILSGVLIDYALAELEAHFKPHKLSWSHRTSIHLHDYIGDMPVIKLKWLVAYYALTELFWYSMCDEKRIGNSFCFPICTTNPHQISYGKQWPKYCGINLGSSLVQFNTVEFRQMHGHQDFALYRKWIEKLTTFVTYIKNTPVQELKRNMDIYLNVGHMNFKPFLGENPANSLIYDNAKWVADFLSERTN